MIVVAIASQQFLVNKGDKIYVPKQRLEAGENLNLKVLMKVDGSKSELDVGNEEVKAKVLGHVKGKKVLVFKKKRRKRYRKTRGHRQEFTQVEILN